MRKRKHNNSVNLGAMDDSTFFMGGTMQSSKPGASKYGLFAGHKPTARDGHSATIDKNGCLYVFGGDRHHMPFNDLYIIKLPKPANASEAIEEVQAEIKITL